MSDKRIELNDEMLEDVSGGAITRNQTKMQIWIKGTSTKYSIHNWDAVDKCMAENYGHLSDGDMISLLKSKGLIG